ncbi:pilus assembly protein PilP [Candidatus Halobeggiatoa sp. HSG11]|nr:pilus assembly protein PilP [Candidatus Halobeggiatoa sp. HSG11]
MNKFMYFVLLMIISACSNRDIADLESYVAKINARENPHVDAIPEVKQIPPYFYEVQHKRDPFVPILDTKNPVGEKLLFQTGSGKKAKDCPNPKDPSRVRVGLELMPLDALRMVGSLKINNILWGLVVSKSEGTVYRVKTGDHIGENYGKIISISDEEINVLEKVSNDNGCWEEKLASIHLFGS